MVTSVVKVRVTLSTKWSSALGRNICFENQHLVGQSPNDMPFVVKGLFYLYNTWLTFWMVYFILSSQPARHTEAHTPPTRRALPLELRASRPEQLIAASGTFEPTTSLPRPRFGKQRRHKLVRFHNLLCRPWKEQISSSRRHTSVAKQEFGEVFE